MLLNVDVFFISGIPYFAGTPLLTLQHARHASGTSRSVPLILGPTHRGPAPSIAAARLCAAVFNPAHMSSQKPT
jgi:hypothetical protein